MLISIKYKQENELVLVQLLKGYGLLSRDGQIHSCNPYVKIELQYNTPDHVTTKGCNIPVADHESTPFTKPPEVEMPKRRLKFQRSISLLHNYEQFKRDQLRNHDHHHNNIDNLDLALHVHVQEQQAPPDNSSPSHTLTFKHKISTTAQSKVAWHTRNPEFNELFLFHVAKEKLTSAFLHVSVMDREILTRDTCIGYTIVPLGTLSITGVQNIPEQWFTIKKVFSCTVQRMMNIIFYSLAKE